MSKEKSKNFNQDSGFSESIFQFKLFLLGLYHILMILLLVYILVKVWPNYVQGENGQTIVESSLNLFGLSILMGGESGLLLLVIVAAALGSYIHSATSFVSYVGNKSLVMSWAWWYILRPFIGVALALVFYFVIRGGLLSANTSAGEVSIYGITAIAGLVGMFSKQATDKLGEVFNTLFKTKEGEGDHVRKDKLGEKMPVSEKMIPLNKIIGYTIPENKSLGEIKINELFDLLTETVTRIPVLNYNNKLLYVIHQSIIYKFIFDKSIASSQDGKPFDVNSLTLEDFMGQEDIKELVEDAIAFIPKDATILNAKEAMEETKNCQDVFITENGSREEKIIGWLTNNDIVKYLSV
jgi:hypothetical protein